jgi:CDP-diacylglycerol--glycerol-3-phosphate 3-phosphatidyltransferase
LRSRSKPKQHSTEGDATIEQQPSNWNVPNALTSLRLVITPFIGIALLHDGGADNSWRWAAYGLFTVAMVTDKIDGDLARKHNLITNFGKIADPIADKAVTGMAFIGLSIIYPLLWLITVPACSANGASRSRGCRSLSTSCFPQNKAGRSRRWPKRLRWAD